MLQDASGKGNRLAVHLWSPSAKYQVPSTKCQVPMTATWHLELGTWSSPYAARGSPNDHAPSSSTPTIVDTPGSSIVTP
jgi:hypothetical protein